LPCGPEPPHVVIRGAPLHPWAKYTDKGDCLIGIGAQLPRHYIPKFFAMMATVNIVSFGLIWFAMAAGPRPKTHSRKWKEAEKDFYYPFEQFPEMKLPADISRDPKAACWRYLDRVGLRDPLVLNASMNLRSFDFKIRNSNQY
jgi:hypothetical protein